MTHPTQTNALDQILATPTASSPRPSTSGGGQPACAVFDVPDRGEAHRQWELAVKKYRANAPKLADWLEANVPQGLTVFALAGSHRRRLRTSNMLERLNEKIKRRTRVAGLFPNDASVLRLVSAVLMEIREDWETNRKYLTMEPG
jgi:putative transposase